MLYIAHHDDFELCAALRLIGLPLVPQEASLVFGVRRQRLYQVADVPLFAAPAIYL